ncbi:t-SNARE coiled-coil Homologuey domain-containing protein [Trichophyton interdigitale]|nr:t-SNARE coiled-coil homology domain-containing protein [Trichophyton interdigitale]KAG5217149.1 t-SNARE coiled-coil homology domain-containing protein [Trichophyton interdigitale]KAG8205742.1 t-SNARE coiled-coil Homologuey domain-containing protein [Trichophyton interdigitale]
MSVSRHSRLSKFDITAGYNNQARGYGQIDHYSGSGHPGNGYNQDVEAGHNNYEMSQYNQPRPQDPNALLNQCRDVDRGIDDVNRYVDQLSTLYRRLLSDVDPARENAVREEVEDLANQTKRLYRNLVDRVKSIKQMPESGNPRNSSQVGKVERSLKAAITRYQQVQADFRKESESQMARQYRIVRPDATDAEVREAVQDSSNQQIFSQALIQSDRRGDAQKVSQMVRARHEEIQKIERDFVELTQMFHDLEAMVIQQEEPIAHIDQTGEEVRENVDKANEEIKGAIDSARARNRKKWWCLLICLLIIIIIVVVIVVVVVIQKK